MRYSKLEDATAWANGTDFGLTASMFGEEALEAYTTIGIINAAA